MYNWCVNIVGAESRYEKTIDLVDLINVKDNGVDVICCYDNVVKSCKPGTGDDAHCNTLCLQHPCEKGGRCKVFGQKQRCHCFC